MMTEGWVKGFYLKFLRGMRIVQGDLGLKRAVVNGVCDVVGALMEVQREGNI